MLDELVRKKIIYITTFDVKFKNAIKHWAPNGAENPCTYNCSHISVFKVLRSYVNHCHLYNTHC